MKKILFCFIVMMHVASGYAQTITTRIANAYKIFENDPQLSNAISSLYVIDAKTGKVVFDKNSKIGLAPASSQKIITAATAYELLGRNFRYETEFGYRGTIQNGNLKGLLYVIGSGDPTFGSWRYPSTKEDVILSRMFSAIQKAGIRNDTSHPTHLVLDLSRYSDEVYNRGWIWEDLANYYGIGSSAINWRENQFDAVITPGDKEGDDVKEIRLSPEYVEQRLEIDGQLKTGKKNSGDQAYFFISPISYGYGYLLRLTGTIPAGVDSFKVSASHPNPTMYFTESLLADAPNNDIEQHQYYPVLGSTSYLYNKDSFHIAGYTLPPNKLYTHISPSLDSINYWFLRKSVNLYGEALIKTLAYQKTGYGETGEGVEIVRDYWKVKGISSTEINVVDGSGLSPLNRVTTNAQVKILHYAKKQSWFPGYYDAFPEYNGMKMKSGTINGVKAFCGYHKSKAGQEYIFSFIVNNYNGSSSAVVQKMYKVLDVLK